MPSFDFICNCGKNYSIDTYITEQEIIKDNTNPIWIHDCDNCEFLGTLFKKYDFYICEKSSNKKQYVSYIIRYGNDGPEYISVYVEDSTLNNIQIGGITDKEKIILAMVHSSPSFILNELSNRNS